MNFLKKLFAPQAPPAYHSKFGGLWGDLNQVDWAAREKQAQAKIGPALSAKLAPFFADGFVVLEGAVAPELADRVVEIVDAGYRNGDARLRYHTDGAVHHVLDTPTSPRGKRIVESHAVLPEVRAAIGSPQVVDFLTAIFEETPVLTQTLVFWNGSEQGLHQDPAYVAFNSPLKMAAAWVALEDIQEGSGELQYLVRSHRLPDYVFSTGKRASHGAAPGEGQAYAEWLVAEAARRNFERRIFRAKKGDVFIWHADLAHGGSPITNSSATRRSLVGHFCPESVLPIYGHAERRARSGEMLYSSYLYDVTAS